jgi:hypothetical protein
MRYALGPMLLSLTLSLGLPGIAPAQTGHSHTDHAASGGMDHGDGQAVAPTEPGQSAFAAIAEIVEILRADPDTNWQTADIETLRQHLIDMDAVTLRADVASQPITGGAIFDVTSDNAATTGSIRRMTLAHAQIMSGVDGIDMRAQQIASGARLTVTGPDAAMIRALGFIGGLSLGMHHQAHHIALARGNDPHQD